MPKERTVNPLVSNLTRVSPYSRCSNDSNSNKLETSFPPSLAEREWEEARCSVCMEHPHNAVLLICSSREKGCQPYMCDTSYQHSNCLDQFCKLFPVASPTTLPEDESLTTMHYHRGRGGQRLSQSNRSLGGQAFELVCPLCRGQISGWVVVEAARRYMNSKIRNCSLESCEFAGNYADLRKHARCEHPCLRPSEVNPLRQSDWARLERQRDLGDTLSAYQSQMFAFNLDEDDLLSDLDQDDVAMDMQSEEGNLFDNFFSGINSETEDEEIEDGNLLLDLNYEFDFSFLSELSFCPWRHDSTNLGSGRTSSSLLNGRRSTRPIYHRENINSSRNATMNSSRNATMTSRLMLNSSPQGELDGRQ